MKTNDKEKIEPPIIDDGKELPPAPPLRQIVIETDGTDIHLLKAEVGGKIELIGILQTLISYLNQPK
jgi:hypothetical protein